MSTDGAWPIQAVQVSKTGVGTTACVKGSFDRVRGQLALFTDELGAKGGVFMRL
jgi:hypothetical protein